MALVELATNIFFVPLFLAILTLKLHFWFKFLYNQNIPTFNIPGPKLASWTRFWIAKVLASGNSAQVWVDVNNRYGPLARIGPNHLVTDDPETIKKILAARSGYVRGPWYESLRINPLKPNIISENDLETHRLLRKKLSTCYNSKAFKEMEPLIDEQMSKWIAQVNSNGLSSAEYFKPFDIGKRIKFLTVDIITKVCLGEELGFVATDSDKYDFLATIQQANAAIQQFSIFLELNILKYYLSKLPFLSRLEAKHTDRSGVGKVMGIVHKAVDEHFDMELCNRKDILSAYLDNGVPRNQIDAEMTIALVAGFDTTSTSIQSTLLAIISNPRVYSRLKTEIQAAASEGLVSSVIQDSEAKRLPYLQACIMEGLRKFPAASQLRERVVPPGGDNILGYPVKGGTYIGINAWGSQLKDVFGDDPEAFRPERWLISDEARLVSMRQTQELVFGHGFTKCLGEPMAMMELRKIIFELLRHFDVTVANPYKPWTSICWGGAFYQEDFNVHITRAV